MEIIDSNNSSISSNVISEAFKKAEEKKAAKDKNNGNGNGNLSTLLNFKVVAMTTEEIEQKKKEAEERKKNAQSLASKIFEIKNEISKIENVQGWDILPELISRRNNLVDFLEKANAVGDKTFQESRKIAGLIRDIQTENSTTEVKVIRWMRHIAFIGRGEFMDIEKAEKMYEGKLPEGTIRFKNFCLLHKKSKIHPDKIASPADQSIFKELNLLIGRYYKNLKTADKKKMKNLLNADVRNISDLKAIKKVGIYRIYFPAAAKDANGKYQEEGIGLVELINISNKPIAKPFLVVKAVDGAGSLRWLSDNKGEWVPLAAVFTGRVLEEKTPTEKLEFAKKFARTLNFACR